MAGAEMTPQHLNSTDLLDQLQRQSPPGPHCKNRIFEWCTAFAMLGISLCVLVTPTTIELGSFRFMTVVGFGDMIVSLIFMAFGLARLGALYANGHWQPYGSWLRAFGALAGGFMWFQMMLALAWMTSFTGTLSIGIPVYAALTVGEIVSCYRASADEIRRSSH